METQNKQSGIQLNPEKFKLSHILIAIGGFLIGGIILLNVLPESGAKASADYQPKAPTQQVLYDSARKNVTDSLQKLCTQWQAVSKAKIEDKINGALKDDRVAEWNQNLKFDCSKVEAQTGF